MWEMVCEDVLEWCKNYTGEPFHAILCDPPYALNFMNKAWDNNIAFQPSTWAALAEHLLPGGFIFAFASSRGWHRLACALEDAGLIIQPSIFNWHTGEVVEVPACLGWLNAQAFPKSVRIDTQIDKAAGKLEERAVLGIKVDADGRCRGLEPHAQTVYERKTCYGQENRNAQQIKTITAPATDLARAWQGHRYGGQILKNALEPIIVAQRPWEGKRLDCIVETGAGALWVDGGRVSLQDIENHTTPGSGAIGTKAGIYHSSASPHNPVQQERAQKGLNPRYSPQGRWPANFVLCHSEGCERVGVKRVKGSYIDQQIERSKSNSNSIGDQTDSYCKGYADPDGMETVDAWECVEGCPVRKLGEQSGKRIGSHNQIHRKGTGKSQAAYGELAFPVDIKQQGHNDKGTAARFFYQADWSHEVAERIAGADPVRYCPKAARKERDAGLENFQPQAGGTLGNKTLAALRRGEEVKEAMNCSKGGKGNLPYYRNPHPTIKPISLNKWLATLLLPPKEYAPRRILIPFFGSGSEGIGAGLAGWEEIIGIDFKQDYCDIAEARLNHWLNKPQQLELP